MIQATLSVQPTLLQGLLNASVTLNMGLHDLKVSAWRMTPPGFEDFPTRINVITTLPVKSGEDMGWNSRIEIGEHIFHSWARDRRGPFSDESLLLPIRRFMQLQPNHLSHERIH